MTTPYKQPKLSDERAKLVMQTVRRQIAGRSYSQLLTMCIALSLENARLFEENNEHREARGIEKLRDYLPG